MYKISNTCIFSIPSGDLNHITIKIISLNISLNISINHIISLCYSLIPFLFRDNSRPALRCKITIKPGGYIRCNHSCFNRKCSTSAKWINQYPVFIPGSQLNKCSCKTLRNWCFSCLWTISSLMKRIACCIKCNSHNIL